MLPEEGGLLFSVALVGYYSKVGEAEGEGHASSL